MKHNPEYRAVPPVIWPLFKLHKLTEDQIKDKVIPPKRFITAAKYGPLYRLGQWSSSHLTKISQDYCGEEFLLDSPHLINNIEDYNKCPAQGNILLATLDIEALYPSIDPILAIQAMKEAFETDDTTVTGIKEALLKFTDISFKQSFVTYRDHCYKSLKGIPTGGCDSRQIADIFLHWLLFNNLKNKLPWDQMMTLFRRYIDDCFLIWKGTSQQFNSFIKKLNILAAKFGIRFGSWELGKKVNFLDLLLYLDGLNRIHYRLFIKPTDARIYLRTDSFHPAHVFNSVAFSQMLRVANRNSKVETRSSDLSQLKKDLACSGHNITKLNNLESKVLQQLNTQEEKSEDTPTKTTIVFPVQYFEELPQLKELVKDIEADLQALLGPTKIVLAPKKGRSIGNKVLRNSAICKSFVSNDANWFQGCGANLCQTCKHMVKAGTVFEVNGQKVEVPSQYNCKTKNCIYLAQCTICRNFIATSEQPTIETSYFGQTMQKFHLRSNGHRDYFNETDYKKSALSLHAYEHHRDRMDMDIFNFAILKECNPRQLNREEFRFIEKYKTNCFGLNRCKVER